MFDVRLQWRLARCTLTSRFSKRPITMKPALRKRHWTSRSSGHAFFTAEGTALPGDGLVAVLAEKVGMEASELVQRKACAMAAVSSTLSEFVPRLPPR